MRQIRLTLTILSAGIIIHKRLLQKTRKRLLKTILKKRLGLVAQVYNPNTGAEGLPSS